MRKIATRPQTASKSPNIPRDGNTPNSDQADGEDIAGYSAALVETLTAHKTAALAAELAQKPEAALAVIVHALLVNVFAMDLHLYGCVSALDVSARRANLAQADGSAATLLLEEQRAALLSLLFKSEEPQSEEQLWQWCISSDSDTLLKALAFLTASTINAVETKTDRTHTPHANRLAQFLKVDMTRWFTPTADLFFSRISKPQILATIREAGKDTASINATLKKADLAALAEREVAGTGWLPHALRIPASDTESPTGQKQLPE
jgi:ParB family chromosome partitioning protein